MPIMGAPTKEQKTMTDGSEIARALAKAIAYKQCGKQRDAEQWAAELVRLLECAHILDRTHGAVRRAA